MKKTISLLLAFVIAFGAPLPSYAGYAQLRVPPGWSPPKTPGTPATFKTGPAANDNTYKGSTVLTNAALEIGGQAVTVPASMRLAANAATIGATYAFGNPAVFAALAVGSAAYLYYQQQGLQVDNNIWVKVQPSCVNGTCTEFTTSKITPAFHPSRTSACRATAASFTYPSFIDPDYDPEVRCVVAAMGQGVKQTQGEFSYTTRTVPQSNIKTPVTLPQFHEIMDPVPVPIGVPQQLPDVEWPYEQPVINPNPSTIPSTYPSPALRPEPRPLWVPTGDPVKNPTTTNPDGSPKPDTWTQPGKDVKPSGTPSDPWRVDVTDAPRTKGDPSPNTSPDVAPTKTPTPTPAPEIVTCGLPGKPKCLIDETGTPVNADTQVNPSKTALDTTSNTARDAIDAVKTISPPSWSFTFQLPTGCTPFVTGLRGVVLNVCSYQPIIHDLMSMIWASATAFALIGMVGRTIREA